ncbi:MAG: hypothetical protein ABI947_25520 [Chloroflexota bacterium]
MLTATSPELDIQLAETPYWKHLINPENAIENKLNRLLEKYFVTQFFKQEFLILPTQAPSLLQELEALGIAVWGLEVWCVIPFHMKQSECCPHDMGGPNQFREYVHLVFSVPSFDTLPWDIHLAQHCNPLVKNYVKSQLNQEFSLNPYLRAFLDLYLPPSWDLFPNKQKKQQENVFLPLINYFKRNLL